MYTFKNRTIRFTPSSQEAGSILEGLYRTANTVSNILLTKKRRTHIKCAIFSLRVYKTGIVPRDFLLPKKTLHIPKVCILSLESL